MNLTKYKHCSKCDNVFPKETGFYPNKARYDNYDSYCRKCHDKISGKNQNLIQRNDTLKVKKCSICKNVYDLTYFIFQNTYGDGFNNQCKECSLDGKNEGLCYLTAR